ncbi:MAG: hypothetical protein GW865_04800 [Candidatus Aenigmarchaeota archaeon]|nr:hypothetical protein [Candidatus Aenigmarchaeota archaeon]
MNHCPDCGSRKVSYSSEGIICANCGMILESAIMLASSEDMLSNSADDFF